MPTSGSFVPTTGDTHLVICGMTKAPQLYHVGEQKPWHPMVFSPKSHQQKWSKAPRHSQGLDGDSPSSVFGLSPMTWETSISHPLQLPATWRPDAVEPSGLAPSGTCTPMMRKSTRRSLQPSRTMGSGDYGTCHMALSENATPAPRNTSKNCNFNGIINDSLIWDVFLGGTIFSDKPILMGVYHILGTSEFRKIHHNDI